MRNFIFGLIVALFVMTGFDAFALAPVTASPWTTTTNAYTARTGLVVYSTSEVNALITSATNGLVTSAITNGLATTNYAKSVTNNFTTLVYTNPSSILYTSSLPALTNGFVTSSITNGLATTNYVNNATNGFVMASITNGLATTNYVNSAIATGNTNFPGIYVTNSAYIGGVIYGNGSGITNIASTNLAGLGTAAYSNATAFYLNSNPSNYATASVTNGLATTNYVNNATNGFVTSSITNGLATTNYVNAATNGFVTSSITNGLATTNYVNNATNGFVTSSITNGLATTNFVLTQISATNGANLTTTTNLVVAATNNFTTLVYTNPSAILYTSSLPALTNGFVTSSITNGLATTNFVLTQISATNSANLTTTTNLVVAATNNFTTVVYSNPVVFLYTNSLPGLTNGLASTNFVNTSIANNTNFPSIYVTNTLQVQGYVQGPLYITNSVFDISTNTASPSANQLVTANYVASILKSGQILYGSLNTTNVGITNRVGTTTNMVALLFGSTAPTNYIKSFTNLTVGQIFATIITTNAYQSVSGPFVSTFYLNFTGNGPNPSIQIDPDIYITYDKTNLQQITYGAAQTITPGTTNAYSWISGGQQYTSTNAAGFYVVRRVICDAVTSSGTYALNVFGGTNYPTSLTFNTPVTLNANYSGTFTGTYIGDGSALTNLNPANLIFNATTQTTAVLNFNLNEIAITNNITFTSATGVASSGYAKYIGATVFGTGITVAWPQIWSPNNTNLVVLTNGLVAFKCFGTNVFAAPYQP